MNQLSNRKVLLGITGGIAAYKSADLVRRLRDHNAEVRVVMTAAATEFITPLTMQALSGQPVHLDLLNTEAEAAMGHIELARWADLILIAPASADFIAKLANGQASDLLSTLCLASIAPLFVAPAMNQAMWAKTSTQENIQRLTDRRTKILGPGSGAQACGDVGMGRMIEVTEIVAQVSAHFVSGSLAGLNVLITAGPTREAIDPVRYLSNHSSGKMGFALARAAADAGAKTVLIAGPVALESPDRVERIDVISAKDMLNATLERAVNCDIFISTAAVADYRPAQIATNKIKKNNEASDKITGEANNKTIDKTMNLMLVQTTDILATVSALDGRPFCVGFAAETNDVVNYAKGKLKRKKLDMIVANDVSNTDIGFQSDQNAVTVINKTGCEEIPQMTKQSLATQLIARISTNFTDSQ